MDNFYREELRTPILGEYDVVVIGGGIGGICAAAAAARQGVRVLLLEKSLMLGGLATLGLISWYEPLCDGFGNKVMYGMASELIQLAVKYGPHSLPEAWRQDPDTALDSGRYACHFSPAVFAMALDEWLLKEGVDLLFDTQVTSPVMQGPRCIGLIAENKTGRCMYRAQTVIDATGDCEFMYRAGVPTVEGKNYLTYIAYKTDAGLCHAAETGGNMIKARSWINSGSDLWGKGHPEDFPVLAGTTAEEITRFVLAGRRRLFDIIREDEPLCRDITVLPYMAQLRTVRRLDGKYTLTEDDEGKSFPDSVGVVADFVNPGKLYQIPYRTLYHEKFDNLFTCGRSISSSGWAWDVTRVIPAAACTGQAAGVAAVFAGTAALVSVPELQRRLRDSGVHLG